MGIRLVQTCEGGEPGKPNGYAIFASPPSQFDILADSAEMVAKGGGRLDDGEKLDADAAKVLASKLGNTTLRAGTGYMGELRLDISDDERAIVLAGATAAVQGLDMLLIAAGGGRELRPLTHPLHARRSAFSHAVAAFTNVQQPVPTAG